MLTSVTSGSHCVFVCAVTGGLSVLAVFPVLRAISLDTSVRSFLVSCLDEPCALIGRHPITGFLSLPCDLFHFLLKRAPVHSGTFLSLS